MENNFLDHTNGKIEAKRAKTNGFKVANTCFCGENQIVFINKNEDGSIGVDTQKIAQSLEELREKKVSNLNIIKASLDWIGLDAAHPLYKSAVSLGKEADFTQNNSYHNSEHLRDVSLLTLNLLAIKTLNDKNIQLSKFHQPQQLGDYLSQSEKEDLACVLIAAMCHDLDHDGLNNQRVVSEKKEYVPFYLEAIAADSAADNLSKHQNSEEHINLVKAMIYSTDVNSGYKIMTDGVVDGSVPKEIAEVFKNNRKMEFCKILRDADVIGSAGLTPEYFDAQTKRLEEEIHFKIDAKGASGFLEKMVGGFFSTAGQVFNDNYQELIRLNQKRLSSDDFLNNNLTEVKNSTKPSI